MSLIATFQSIGPNATINTITERTIRPSTARRWRRKRRHASAAGETLRSRGAAEAATGESATSTPMPAGSAAAAFSAIADAGVEPAIEQVRDQVEEDDQAREHEGHGHDHRRVVAQD